MKKRSFLTFSALLSSVLLHSPTTLADKIEFLEGRTGNDYYKYPKICSIEKNNSKEGFDYVCAKNDDFKEYVLKYTSSYGDNISAVKPTGIKFFQSVGILPGEDPFIQTDLVITPKVND